MDASLPSGRDLTPDEPRSSESVPPEEEGPHDLLSKEEIRELFSPLPEAKTTGVDPVLILADSPEDAETLSAYLGRLRVPSVLAVSRFMALDLFRDRSYQVLVSSPESWGTRAPAFLERFRAVDPEVAFCFLSQAGEELPLEDAVRVERPLSAENLEPLKRMLSLPVATSSPTPVPPQLPGESVSECHETGVDSGEPGPASEGRSEPEAGDSGVEDPSPEAFGDQERPSLFHETSGSGSTSSSPEPPEAGDIAGPDPILAVSALLAARLDGRTLSQGLRDWSRRDPALLGMVEVSVGCAHEPNVACSRQGANVACSRGEGAGQVPSSLGEREMMAPEGVRAGESSRRAGQSAEAGGDAAVEDIASSSLGSRERAPAVTGRAKAQGSVDRGVRPECDEGFECKFWTRDPRQRATLMQLTAPLIAQEPADLPEAGTQHGFYVFAQPDLNAWTALWFDGPIRGASLAERLTPVMELLGRVSHGPAPAVADASPAARTETHRGSTVSERDRFARLVYSRMKLCERREGRLSLLVAEGGDELDFTIETLQSATRGTDWVESLGDRVYAILEQPETGVFSSVEKRIRALPGSEELRIVGLHWTPREGPARETSAFELLTRAEGVLDENAQSSPAMLFFES